MGGGRVEGDGGQWSTIGSGGISVIPHILHMPKYTAELWAWQVQSSFSWPCYDIVSCNRNLQNFQVCPALSPYIPFVGSLLAMVYQGVSPRVLLGRQGNRKTSLCLNSKVWSLVGMIHSRNKIYHLILPATNILVHQFYRRERYS